MSHSLAPTATTPQRSLDEMLRLLRDEFRVFDANRDRGDELISDMITHWLMMKRTRESWNMPGDTSELDSMIQRWSAHRGNAAFVVVGDVDNDEDRRVDFNLVPGEQILIGYAHARHQALAEPLARRIARTLEYEGAIE